MNSDTVQVNVQVSSELLEKAKRYDIDMSDAIKYGIEQLAQNQLSVIGQDIGFRSLWWGFLGCIPSALILLIFQPVGYWLLADLLVQIVGMFGGIVLSMRRNWRRYYVEHPEAAPDGWTG